MNEKETFPGWVIFHIPHDSFFIPNDVRDQFVLSDEELNNEIVKMTDFWTLVLYGNGIPASQIIAAPVSRLVVDVERFEEDSQEIMAERGMGVIYQSTHRLTPLRRTITPEERQSLLKNWYRPHHEALTLAVDRTLAKYGKALVLDLHSFPSKALPYEDDEKAQRPEICIGTDAFHTPDQLKTTFVKSFSHGFELAVNTPFGGALVPMKHYQQNPNVMCLMVELRRDLYENEATGAIREDFGSLSRQLKASLLKSIQEFELIDEEK